MSTAPNLLNSDGTASMATMLMLSHHAFRRDIARFLRAIEQVKNGDTSRAEQLRTEWEISYRQAIHGHHMAEDNGIFPDIRSKHPDIADAIDTLTAQHHGIDPVLERGDEAFAHLSTNPERTEEVLQELKNLLDVHLAFEEAQVTPHLRDAHEFPTPPDAQAATMYAHGFAWSMQGIAPEVLEQVRKILPPILVEKLPAAQAEFETRCARVWGEYTVGTATTPIPEVY